MKTSKIERAVDTFYNVTFSKELTERTIFSQEFVTSQKILFNCLGYLVFDKIEGNVSYRYFYCGTYLCAIHFHSKAITHEQVDYENLVIYDYGNINHDAIRRLYRIQKELESFLPRNLVPRSDHKVPTGHVRVYTQEQTHGFVPSL